MEKWRDRLFKLFFFAAFIAIVVTGVMYSYPKYRQAQDFREKQRRFNTDREFVESLARQNRRVYPGELVFIFDE